MTMTPTVLAWASLGQSSGYWLAMLLDTSLKGLIILGAAGVVTLAMRKFSATARHMVWLLAMTSLLALPVLSAVLPGWAILPQWTDLESKVAPTPQTVETVQAPRQGAAPPVVGKAAPPEVIIPKETLAAPAPEPVATKAPSKGFLLWAILIWAAGAAVCFIPLALGYLSLWRLKRNAQPIKDGPLMTLFTDVSRQLFLKRPVTLLTSDRRPMPMIWGLFSSKLLLPSQAAEWSSQRQRVVLLHELAHVARRDCIAKFISNIACALYWFNPMAWIGAKWMQIEAETACDDRVLNAGAKPSSYAEHLLEIASGLQTHVFAAHCSNAMARKSKLEGRLLAILDSKHNRRALTRVGVLLAAILVAGIAIPLACMKAPRAVHVKEAAISLYMDLDSGTNTGANPPVVFRITDPKQLETLAAFFPEMDQGKDSGRSGSWSPGVRIKFVTRDGRTIRVAVSSSDDLTIWSEGKGDWPVKGDLKAFLLDIQKKVSAATDGAGGVKATNVSVRGRVLTEPDGTGAVGRRVLLWKHTTGRDQFANTDRNGEFEFHAVEAGNYTIRVTDQPEGIWSEGIVVSVGNEPVISDDLFLKLPQCVAGTVRDSETDKALPGEEINFSTAERNRAAIKTDKNGRYQLYVTPRKVSLKYTGDRCYSPPERIVEVARGQMLKDIDIKAKTAQPFTGTLVMPTGEAVSDIPIRVTMWWSKHTPGERKRIAHDRKRWPENETPELLPSSHRIIDASLVWLKTDEHGRFTGYLKRPPQPNGNEAIDIYLVARLPERSMVAFSLVQTTTFQPSLEPIALKFKPAAVVEFSVVDAAGNSVNDAIPGAYSCWFDGVRESTPAHTMPQFKALGNGRYRGTGVVPGLDYGIDIVANGKGYYRREKAIRFVAKPGEVVNAGTFRLTAGKE